MAYSSSHGTVNNRPHVDSDDDDKFERDLKEILSEGSNSNNHSNSTGHAELGSGMARVGGSSSAATGQAYRPNTLPPGTHSATVKSSVIAPGSLYCYDVICSLVDNNIKRLYIYERISVLTKSDSMTLN